MQIKFSHSNISTVLKFRGVKGPAKSAKISVFAVFKKAHELRDTISGESIQRWKKRFRVNRNGAWDSAGCRVINMSESRVVCSCSRLGNFVVLMQPVETPDYAQIVFRYIFYIGLAVSIFLLFRFALGLILSRFASFKFRNYFNLDFVLLVGIFL